jgi:hypothetical protein
MRHPDSICEIHGYKLSTEHLPLSDIEERNGWTACVIEPNGQAIDWGRSKGPYTSREGAQDVAEIVVRRSCAVRGQELPPERFTWALCEPEI